jgi:hypothetical protein
MHRLSTGSHPPFFNGKTIEINFYTRFPASRPEYFISRKKAYKPGASCSPVSQKDVNRSCTAVVRAGRGKGQNDFSRGPAV